MRYLSSPIWNKWRSGRYVGNSKTRLVVTIEPDWWLTLSSHTNADNSGTLGTYSKGPVRWWQRNDRSQYEVEVPNVKSLQWDRDVDTPTPTCTITVMNVLMPTAGAAAQGFGDQGHFSPRRGGEQIRPTTGPYQEGVKRDRWGRTGNDWYGMLQAGSVFRTYEGYCDPEKDWKEAVEDGDIVQTGVWMCDDTSITTSGDLSMRCRGLSGPLLADQRTYSNSDEGIVPRNRYPLRYAKWTWTSSGGGSGPIVENLLRTDYWGSSTDIHYPHLRDYTDTGLPGIGVQGRGAPVHGHYPADAVDQKANTFWFSEGYSSANGADARPWIELHTWSKPLNAVRINGYSWQGANFRIYISVLEDGAWKGANTIPYNVGSNPVDINSDIPYVKMVTVPGEVHTTVDLDRTYNAERIRLTFANLNYFQWGPNHYRAALREVIGVYKAPKNTSTPLVGIGVGSGVRSPGNMDDWVDPVKDLLLWSGYWLLPDADSSGRRRETGPPNILGVIESTGAWPEETPPAEMWDKRPPLDIIADIADVVAYAFFEGPDGEIHFHSRNIYKPGNRNEDFQPIATIPQLHEAQVVLDATAATSTNALRSGITIATNEPATTAAGADVVVTRFRPDFKATLRGVRKPAIWVNGLFIRKSEQEKMAQLLATRMWMKAHSFTVEIPGNPLLDPDDQVRLVERIAGIDDIVYISGISSTHDVASGKWTMTLTCQILGDINRWAVSGNAPASERQRRRYLVEEGDDWARIHRRILGRAYPDSVRLSDLKRINQGKDLEPGTWLDW